MSGGPPHHPHNRHAPPTNSAWNHLQVPTYFQRQPQVAHMQAEHSLLHQPTWHTPTTTEAMKLLPHTQMLNEMFKTDSLFPRDCVDLSLTRNVKKPFLGNQNGELPSAPAAISLSVRDANKINSLPPGMLDIQAVELTKCASPNLKSAVSPGSIRGPSMSPGIKATSPGLLSSGAAMKSLSPGRKSLSPGPVATSTGVNLASSLILPTVASTLPAADLGKNQKRSNIRVDSILERLNTIPERTFPFHDIKHDHPSTAVSAPTPVQEKSQTEKPHSQNPSVIVQTASNFDENSNSSGTTNVPTPKEEDSASMHSNEDSLDSTKSRRKRKPSKTIRVNKDEEIKIERDIPYEAAPTEVPITNNHKEEPAPANVTLHPNPVSIATILEGTTVKLPERLEETTDEVDGPVPIKIRRKASSESETIDNIAAMVQEGLKDKDKKTVREDGCLNERMDVEQQHNAKPAGDKLEDITGELKSKPNSKDLTAVPANIVSEPVINPETSPIIMTADFPEKESEKSQENISKSVPMDTVDEVDIKDIDLNPETQNSSAVSPSKSVTISVIKNKEKLEEALSTEKSASLIPDLVETSSITVPLPVPLAETPAPKKATNTQFVEVENKLEEMFAGIVEDHVDSPSKVPLEPLRNDLTLSLTDDRLDEVGTPLKEEAGDNQEASRSEEPGYANHEVKTEDEKDEKKPLNKKTRRSRLFSRSDQEGDVPTKKKKLTKTKSTVHKKLSRPCMGKKPSLPVTSNKSPVKVSNVDVVKDVYSYDSGSNASSSKSRGPFLQIRGPRDSPLSVSVVNTPLTGDEDGEKKTLKNKKFHDDSEYRHKVRSKGLHCSTLSNKYDAERKDASWICAFCKRGPHASEFTGPSVVNEVPPPGDLFGPYFITTQCPEFEKRLDDVYDRQFKSRKISKALDAAANSSKSKKTKRKSESSVDSTDIYLGITDTGNNTYEVWVHEDCMVWSPGVYLVGPKIAGLEEAVWTCSNLPCSVCNLKGANVTCVKRGCLSSSHVCCARKKHWQLDEANFKAYCPEHLL